MRLARFQIHSSFGGGKSVNQKNSKTHCRTKKFLAHFEMNTTKS